MTPRPVSRGPRQPPAPTRRSAVHALVGLTLAVLSSCVGLGRQDPPAVALERGWGQFAAGEFDRAAATFAELGSREDSDLDGRVQAWFGGATTWHLRRPGQDAARATALYQRIQREAPNHDLAAWSGLQLARLGYAVAADQHPDYPAVAALYEAVISRYPDHPAATEAWLMRQAMRLETANGPDIPGLVADLARFQRLHPEAPYQAAAWSLRAYGLTLMDSAAAACSARGAAIDAYGSEGQDPTVDLSHARWQLACQAEFEAGDFALARAAYRRFIADYPTDQRLFVAKQELRRMDELEASFRAEARGNHGR